MKADTHDLTQVFYPPIQYRVPLFQRPYVWDRQRQWEPLWMDIQATATALLLGHAAPPHFLGAVVFDRMDERPQPVTPWTVIDGQQRLTTLLLFVNAARTVAADLGFPDQAQRFAQLTMNDEKLARHDSERLKMVPSEFDRDAFEEVMRDRPRAATPSPEGRLIRSAHDYFRSALRDWFGEVDRDAQSGRFDALSTAVWRLLQLVVIQLGEGDDAQAIFEALNARGTPLLAADLIKNLIFQEIGRAGGDVEQAYVRSWQALDTDAWRRMIRQGRLFRPRVDVFLMHWLTMTVGQDVLVDAVYATFRELLRTGSQSADEVLSTMRRYADAYDAFDRFDHNSPEGRFFYRLAAMDTTTAFPAVLWMFGPDGIESDSDRRRCLAAIESWLVRRMVCGLTAKAYNSIFGRLLSAMRRATPSDRPAAVFEFFSGLNGPTEEWPTDDQVRVRLTTLPAYTSLVRRRLRMLFEALEEAHGSDLSEQIRLGSDLTVEHVLPQEWHAHWPLPIVDDPQEAASRRDESKHRLGNLTLITHTLNSTQSNSGWTEKRKLLDRYSLLLISKDIVSADHWDEEAIAARTARLSDQIVRLWPGPPESGAPEFPPAQIGPEDKDLDRARPGVTQPVEVGDAPTRNSGPGPRPAPRERRPASEERARTELLDRQSESNPMSLTFDAAMLNVYESAKREAGYRATRFLQKVRRDGGLEAARYFLRQPGVSTGFLALKKAGKLDLSTEYIVLQPAFAQLFSVSEREVARQRLLDHGMSLAELP